MLIGVTRIGALRQRIGKGFATGDSSTPPARGRHGTAFAASTPAGLWHASTPLTWLGSAAARDEWAAAVSADLTASVPGALPTGIAVQAGGRRLSTPAGDDRHVLEVASSAEQEVLCNLLREHVPLLIALTGRAGPDAAGAGGSQRLAASREHIATRYLASTYPDHLSRVRAELRRVDGVDQLDRMDVFPGAEPDGTLTVTLRCVDAAATVATARAHALLIAALGLRARRLVRDGRRQRNVRQNVLEENRARAIARGLRAHLTVDPPNSGRDQARDRGQPPPAVQQSARDLLRTLLVEVLSIELDNLGATAEELFPIIAPLDLPKLGLGQSGGDDELLRGWAAQQPAGFASIAGQALRDGHAGGPSLVVARQTAPGRVGLLLDEWTAIIAARRSDSGKRAGRPPAPRDGARPQGPRDQRQSGQQRSGQQRSGLQRSGQPKSGLQQSGPQQHRREGDK